MGLPSGLLWWATMVSALVAAVATLAGRWRVLWCAAVLVGLVAVVLGTSVVALIAAWLRWSSVAGCNMLAVVINFQQGYMLTLCAVATWALLTVAPMLLRLSAVACLGAVLALAMLLLCAKLTRRTSMLLLSAIATMLLSGSW